MSALREEWRDSPRLWKDFPLKLLPNCTIKGEVYDTSGVFICKYKPIKNLGEGTFGHVDVFTRTDINNISTTVAIKRPKIPQVKLLNEAFFQWKLHHDLISFGLSFCVPKVYDVFLYKVTKDVWFSMEAFEPNLLSQWCIKNIQKKGYLVNLLLQVSLILEVFEKELKIDHRDLKINNMLILDEPVMIEINWNNKEKILEFPFRIVFLDFGFACMNRSIDVRDSNPSLDACPKEGRNIFQILVSLWNNETLRNTIDKSWGTWIQKRISTIYPSKYPSLSLTESNKQIDWMYTLTDDREFRAPLCAPIKIIRDCMAALEGQ